MTKRIVTSCYIGRKFGRLTVIEKKPDEFRFLCLCECGTRKYIFGQNLSRKYQSVKSCGCLKSEINSRTPRIKMPEYRAYSKMKSRCSNPLDNRYQTYGGRGIRVCERWLYGSGDEDGFSCFIYDLGSRPSGKHSIDRINNDGDYEPDNCRWATRIEQANNTTRNRIVNVDGHDLTLSEACRKLDLNYKTIHKRLMAGRGVSEAFGINC